jgi:hypothetical protein
MTKQENEADGAFSSKDRTAGEIDEDLIRFGES